MPAAGRSSGSSAGKEKARAQGGSRARAKETSYSSLLGLRSTNALRKKRFHRSRETLDRSAAEKGQRRSFSSTSSSTLRCSQSSVNQGSIS